MNSAFIHSELDDYGLSAPAFRVYCHIVRRAGNHGKAYPSVKSMARICNLHPKTVHRCLAVLVKEGLVTAEKRLGNTTVYTPNPITSWAKYSMAASHPDQYDTSASDTPRGDTNSIPTYPSQLDTHKGNPQKGYPVKGNPNRKLSFTSRSKTSLQRKYQSRIGNL